MKKLSCDDLEKLRKDARKQKAQWVKVGMSSCGIAAGAQEVYDALAEEIKKRNLEVEVRKCGCVGKCYAEPMVEVHVNGAPKVTYGRVTKEIAQEIVEKHLCAHTLVNDAIFESEVKGID